MWEHIPALSGQSRELIEQQRPDRLAQDPIALAAALRGIGQAAFDPMWDQLPSIDCPTLLVTGARDAVYTGHAKRMLELLPNATHAVVNDAGHAVHLAQPATTAAVVSRFLDDRFS
jgi:2-succinyl-6-hydroxy-2,4-cyclohexadiene-1-carboxylate synthase